MLVLKRLRILAVPFLCFAVKNLSCSPSPCLNQMPDLTHLSQLVLQPALRDSLQQNALSIGMPYAVVRQIFGNCKADAAIPVASKGSRQMLLEKEGLYTHFHDPSIEMFMDKFPTSRGTLYIWYGNPSYYRSEVMKGDLMILYSKDRVDTATISCLTRPRVVCSEKHLRIGDVICAEIRHREQRGKITYWYDLAVIDSHCIKQKPLSTGEYPIVQLELETTVIQSYHWR